MSQFSQKYYKHYIVKDDAVEVISFWMRTRVLQGTILSLLLLLFLALLLFCTKCGCATHTTQTRKIQEKETITVVHPKIKKVEKKSEKTEQKESPKLTLEEKLPKRVLPQADKLLPKEEVSIEDYMYFVNDTKNGYPKFVDVETNRMIKEYKPTCSKLDCPISGVSKENQKAYIDWLNTMSDKEYKIQETDKGFRVELR